MLPMTLLPPRKVYNIKWDGSMILNDTQFDVTASIYGTTENNATSVIKICCPVWL